MPDGIGVGCETKGGVRTDAALVCLGCYNKIPQAGWLINNKNLLLAVPKARSPRSWSPHGQVRALL